MSNVLMSDQYLKLSKAEIIELLRDFYREIIHAAKGDPYNTTKVSIVGRWDYPPLRLLFITLPYHETRRIDITGGAELTAIINILQILQEEARKLIITKDFEILQHHPVIKELIK